MPHISAMKVFQCDRKDWARERIKRERSVFFKMKLNKQSRNWSFFLSFFQVRMSELIGRLEIKEIHEDLPERTVRWGPIYLVGGNCAKLFTVSESFFLCYHSPTPPEPRITILYSRIFEILADYPMSWAAAMNRLFVHHFGGRLNHVNRKVFDDDSHFSSILMPFVASLFHFFALASGCDDVIHQKTRSTSRKSRACLVATSRSAMLNLLGTKTCASTPRKEEKQKIWERSYVGMTSVWTCGVEWCHWFRNGIRHWRFCAPADVRESAIFPYQPEASIATLLSRSLPVSLDLEFHQSERYLQTRPKNWIL